MKLSQMGGLLFLCLWLTTNLTKAQVYCFTQTSSSYTDLPTPVSINNGAVWDDSVFFVPIGFNFSFFGKTLDSLAIGTEGIFYPYDSLNVYDLRIPIMPFGSKDSTTDLIDRGYGSGISVSPIGYELSGSPGSRIFKIEFKNAGFKPTLPTLAQYISFQLWLYEETNVLEYRIGSTNADANCFNGASGPAIGLGNTTSKSGYYLSGDPGGVPILSDTIALLDTVPAEGTVYSFSPSTLVPAVSIVSDIAPPCANSALLFTAIAVNGGPTPVYEWRRNDTIVGTNAPTYSQPSYAEGDEIRCFLKSSLVCANSLPVASNRIYTLEPVAEVFISTLSSTVCGNKMVSFTAHPQNEGDNPSYQWRKNGLPVGTDNAQYQYSNPTDGDTIQCFLISDEACVIGNPATSNKIGLTTIVPLVPATSIAADKDSICFGEPITFTAAATNGGSTPKYLWYKNGILQESSKDQFTDLSFLQGDTVVCKLVSGLSCISDDTVVSSKLSIRVSPQIQPHISISTASTTVCSILNTNFNATLSNGGTAPIYEWRINNVAYGSNSNLFAHTGFTDKDTVYCIVTSSMLCGAKDTSNSIVLTVLPASTPSLSIAADVDSVCQGGTLSFSGNAFYAGTTPVYEWRKNNVPTGNNTSAFNSNSLADGDIITCVLISSERCVSQASVTSNPVAARIVPYTNAAISITASQAIACTTTTVTFQAMPSASGPAPVYQWRKNNNVVGTNNPVLSMAGFEDGDAVTCRMTSSMFCVNNSPATSNSIIMTIIPSSTAAVSITADQNPVCTGGKVKFTASVTGTATPTYQWKLNNVNTGINSSVFTLTNMDDLDQISCELTNALTCSGAIPVSNTVVMAINPSLDPSIVIQADKTSLCTPDTVTFTASVANGGTSPFYQWKRNGIPVGTNSPLFQVVSLSNNDAIVCEYSNAGNCITSSNTISVAVSSCLSTLSESEQLQLSIYPNPFEEELSIEFIPDKETTIVLMDLMGKALYTSLVKAHDYYETKLSTDHFVPGVYLLRFINEKGVHSEKILKLP